MAEKIGIDFHGVITGAVDEFAVFCKEIRKRGIKVYIISGGPKDDVVKYIKKYNIEYDEVWAIYDYYDAQGVVERYENGIFKVETTLWNKAKAEYCAKEDIKFHIDDSTIYGNYFVTPYCQYDMKDGVCEMESGFKVDFSKPEQAAENVAEFIKTGKWLCPIK